VKVQNNVSLYTGVEVADEVFIGPSAVFTNVRNPRAFIPRRDQYAPTRLGRGCTLGANVTIVCGIDIGEYAFIGAGAVVTREVPAFALILGTPGRIAGWVSRAGHRLQFDYAGHATCPETGEQYHLQNDRCIPVQAQ
jgi:UDP-2-acetamido-3-amino-2,3-dideoxy-glucuronate N-acetyltransferase